MTLSFVFGLMDSQKIFSINSIAQHNAINAGLSVAIAHYCKVPIDLIKQRLQFTEMPERRLAISSSIKGSSLIDDSYNSNPASLRNALKSISNSDKRKYVYGRNEGARIRVREYAQGVAIFGSRNS